MLSFRVEVLRVSAAIYAARMGVDVTLIERYGHLGGQATGGLVIVLCGLTDGKNQIIKGLCQEIIDDLKAVNAVKSLEQDVVFDPEALKYLFDRYILRYNVKIYFHSFFRERGWLSKVGVEEEGR